VQASIEQLGDITEADTSVEGVKASKNSLTWHKHEGRDLYLATWEDIHGPGRWVPSLWVWRIGFRVETAGDSRMLERSFLHVSPPILI